MFELGFQLLAMARVVCAQYKNLPTQEDLTSVSGWQVLSRCSVVLNLTTLSVSIAWGLLEMQNLGPFPDLQNQNLHFNTI